MSLSTKTCCSCISFLRIRANAHYLCRTGYFFETPCFTLHIVIGGSALWRLLIIAVSYLVVTTNEFIYGRSPPTAPR